MSEKQAIARELDAAANSDRETSSLDVTTEQGRLQAELIEVDRLACAFTGFSYSTDRLRGAASDRLRRVASDLAERLSYLLESIQPIEFDEDGCVIQMRSLPPSRDEGTTRFYELLVRPGDLQLCRYAKQKGTPRQVIPAEVTREVLTRLASDFMAAAATA